MTLVVDAKHKDKQQLIDTVNPFVLGMNISWFVEMHYRYLDSTWIVVW